MCHGIVSAMGGDIRLDSTPGRGATFHVSLPVAVRDNAQQRGDAGGGMPSRTGARILIVDDEPGVVAMLERALEGHDVVCADSGREALRRILGDASYDLVLCDLMMPDLTGMDVYREVQRARPALARTIAFITAGAFSPSAQEFLGTCRPPCLDKPFTMAELRAFVDSLLSRGSSAEVAK
jgi:DNA-binding response OmpR family regulator